MKCGILALAITSAVLLAPASDVYAHGHGSGHHSSSSTSYYYCDGHDAHTHTGGVCPYADDVTYYHCGGHPEHLHENGVCPYANTVSKSTIKKVQKKLNSCGYNCGKADGVMGTKTKKALKKYQKDNGLTVDGVIGKATLKSLGLA